MFSFLKKKSINKQVVSTLYQFVAAAALRADLFVELNIPDTLEGRFEALALHMSIIVRHMQKWPPPSGELALDLTDHYFTQLDDVLRELGISDNKVPKKMKEMAGIYLSRAMSYDEALEQRREGQLQALFKDYFGEDVDAARLSHYALTADDIMRDSHLSALLEKGISFPLPVAHIGDLQ